MRPGRLTLILDADDTLWPTEVYYRQCIAEFGALMAAQGFDRAEAERYADVVDRERAPQVGFGQQEFARTLGLAYERLCARYARPVEEDVTHAVWEIGRAVIDHPIVLYDGVAETVARLSERFRLLVLTRGDPDVQRQKLARSGLAHFFEGVHVVPKKDADVFRGLIAHYGLQPEYTWMVGDSPRSDINPAVEAGLGAVYVPCAANWGWEHAEVVPSQRVTVLQRFADLLTLSWDAD